MAAVNPWKYDDIYSIIIQYIDKHLGQEQFLLNFGVIALHRTLPRILIRFTLRKIATNSRIQWEAVIEGNTLSELFTAVKEQVEARKSQL